MRIRIILLLILLPCMLSSCTRRRSRSMRSHGNIERNKTEIEKERKCGDEESGIDFNEQQKDVTLLMSKVSSNAQEIILHRMGYITSYNPSTKNANWVAWHLTQKHTDGPFSRKAIPYFVDEDIDGYRQELEDWEYIPVGYDHGHLCPAGDNKWNADAMTQTFLLTNMCAQNSKLNQGDWNQLEERCRGWAKHYGDVYIACGPIFYSNDYETFGDSEVGIPDAFFKVVLCLKKEPKALGFIYPNNGEHHKIHEYVKTVDEVEKITGIDFFYNLPDEVENEVEAVSDFRAW